MRLTGSLIGVLFLAGTADAYQPSGGNTGYTNTGYTNTGYTNTGYTNTGYTNTGYTNTGYTNTGYTNTGYTNTGYTNTAFVNTGYTNGGTTSATKLKLAGTVAYGQWVDLGYLPVTPGNTFQIVMTGTGDVDLYVKFGSQASYSSWDCRPYTGGSYETCSLTVPNGVTTVYFAAHGYTAGSFAADVTGYDITLDRMKTNQDQPIINVSLSGSRLVGDAWVYETVPVYECEDPYGCWVVGYEGQWNYRALSAYEFTGAAMQSTVVGADSSTIGVVATRITSVQQNYNADADTWLYGVEVFERTSSNGGYWKPLCGTNANNEPIKAVAVQGGWNYQEGAFAGGSKNSSSANQVTWACMNGAIGKCAAGKSVPNGIGYKPWVSQQQFYRQQEWVCSTSYHCRWETTWIVTTGTGSSSHQACTRMVRADYCGDGMPHTVAGRQIDVWDMLPNAVNTKDYGVTLPPGGSWRSNGANQFSCNGRVDYMWPNECTQGPNQVYCEGRCPTYTTPSGGTFKHTFGIQDDGRTMCILLESYNSQQSAPGVTFNRNELVNTNANW